MFSFIVREDVNTREHEVVERVGAVVNSTIRKACLEYEDAVQEHRVNMLPGFYGHLYNIKGIKITNTYDHVSVNNSPKKNTFIIYILSCLCLIYIVIYINAMNL